MTSPNRSPIAIGPRVGRAILVALASAAPLAATAPVSAGNCPPSSCPADVDQSGDVGTPDLLILLASWGDVAYPVSCLAPPEDLVDTADLLALLAAWGACPNVFGDRCENPMPIELGDHPISTIDATTDGAVHEGCPLEGQVYNDLWFEFVSPVNATYRVSTCNQSAFDTALVVYDAPFGSPCPPDGTFIVACSDDEAGCSFYSSELTFSAFAGQRLLIRCGGAREVDRGPATLTIEQINPPLPFECPPDAVHESDQASIPCPPDGSSPLADENGGCNSEPDAFGTLEVGQSICGELGTYVGDDGDAYRDTDWYAFFVPREANIVTLSASSESSAIAGIVNTANGSCDVAQFIDSAEIAGGGMIGRVRIPLVPEFVYAAFIAPDVFEGRPCDGGSDGNYALSLAGSTLDFGACCLPDAALACLDGLTAKECAALGGDFFPGQLCSNIDCNAGIVGVCCRDECEENATRSGCSGLWIQQKSCVPDPCLFACEQAQPITGPLDPWTFGAADVDLLDTARAEELEVCAGERIESLRLAGLTVTPRFFMPCDELEQTFEITIYDDDPAAGGIVLCSDVVTSIGDPTGEFYSGVYELHEWNVVLNASCPIPVDFPWVRVQASGGSTDCAWFWGSSGFSGGGYSLLEQEGVLTVEYFDMNYCLEPLIP